MSLYKKNIEFFKNGNSLLYNIITEQKPLFEVKVEEVEQADNFVVEYGNVRCFIHSIYDMDREMELMFRDVDKETERIILFGFGSGRALEYIAKNFKKVEKIFVVEPSKDIFKAYLNTVDMDKIISRFRNISLVINQTYGMAVAQILELTKENANKTISIAYHLSYRSLYQEYFNKFKNELIQSMLEFRMNMNTFYRNTYDTPQHVMRNIKKNSVPIQRLMEKISGIPAIMVSAGPSLNKNMHLLEKAKKKALVIPVGSAIKILDSNGIIPHLRSAYSPGETEIEVFRNIDTEAAPLIHSDIIFHEVLPIYNGPTIRMLLNNSYLSEYIYEKCGYEPVKQIRSEFTIANVTFNILCMSYCSKIILAGQDMCFTGESLYAKGSWTATTIDSSDSGFIKAKDLYGNDVYTMPAFISIRNRFEETAGLFPGIEFINATEGGLPIPNIKNMTLEEVLDSLPERNDIQDIINEVLKSPEASDPSRVEALNNAILEMEKEINQIIDLNDERFERIKKLSKYKKRNMGINKLILELGAIDDFEKEMLEIPLYKKVVQNELSGIISTINMAFNYDGNDKYKMVEAMESLKSGITIEVARYMNLLRALVKEFNEIPENAEETDENKE